MSSDALRLAPVLLGMPVYPSQIWEPSGARRSGSRSEPWAALAVAIVRGVDFVTSAAQIARRQLSRPLPRRWAHTRGVARRAASLRPILGPDADLVHAAAWLHDVGYAPNLVTTGFHPLDGTRYLRDVEGLDPQLCHLVAHHTHARIEAAERGLADELNTEFPAGFPVNVTGASTSTDVHPADALTYCDITTSPDGDQVAAEDRLAEIHARYGPGHVVTQFVTAAAPYIKATVDTVERALAQTHDTRSGTRHDD